MSSRRPRRARPRARSENAHSRTAKDCTPRDGGGRRATCPAAAGPRPQGAQRPQGRTPPPPLGPGGRYATERLGHLAPLRAGVYHRLLAGPVRARGRGDPRRAGGRGTGLRPGRAEDPPPGGAAADRTQTRPLHVLEVAITTTSSILWAKAPASGSEKWVAPSHAWGQDQDLKSGWHLLRALGIPRAPFVVEATTSPSPARSGPGGGGDPRRVGGWGAGLRPGRAEDPPSGGAAADRTETRPLRSIIEAEGGSLPQSSPPRSHQNQAQMRR
jgi:hypothetical protein